MEKEIEPNGIGPDRIGVDISGYSEKDSDLAIDRNTTGGQNTKQFNRGLNITKKIKSKKTGLIFEKK